ncbi:hypothetical protein F5B17DRAFT_404437 [Nemania serpens]|nr:hypothetical protein F5B17DRAFT_404437 [Nemania serpens]
MATKEFELLAAFGEPTFFRTAFNYELKDIVAWLQACIKGEKGGDATKDPAITALLSEIGSRLSTLILPNGAQFMNPNVKPDSHFPRKLDPKWKPASYLTETKFLLLSLGSTYQRGLEKAVKVNWWNPYDLLGFSLSVLGPAPAGANKNNYFLPLTAVYARWCSRIAGRPMRAWGWTPSSHNGQGDWPFMFNATWRLEKKSTDGKIFFFLGSSTAGDNWLPKEVGQWRTRVQRQRFDTLFAGLQMKLFEQDSFDMKTSKVQQRDSNAFCYGNCAETYPFIFSVRGGPSANDALNGLALKREFMKAKKLSTYDPTAEGSVWQSLCGPCDNCDHIIKAAGGDPTKFSRNRDKRYAPKTSTPTQTTTSMDESTTAPMATTTTEAPNGWSNKPEDMNTDYYWGTNGEGTDAAKRVGLTSPVGLLIADPDRGGDRYIFQDNNTKRIYLWSMLTNEIFEYTKPTDLNGIIAQLKLPVGKASLESSQLDDV